MLPSCAAAAEVLMLRVALGTFRKGLANSARVPRPTVEAMPAILQSAAARDMRWCRVFEVKPQPVLTGAGKMMA